MPFRPQLTIGRWIASAFLPLLYIALTGSGTIAQDVVSPTTPPTARHHGTDAPLVDLGPPFGELRLIEEIDTAVATPVKQSPENASTVQSILGRPCRVITKTTGRSAFFSYRIGKGKQLRPGKALVLAIEYPEDAPRSVIVMNGGNETSVGFHTGTTFGDALHPKYVNNLNESLDLPLTGEFECWTSLFRLHDRTPDIDFIRGDAAPRRLTPEDGFTVTIAQFSAENIPFSHGAAVSRIRLFAAGDPDRFDAKYRLPQGLPQRRLFWREEMSDGVVSSDESKRGVTEVLDWWRYKRDQMRFLGFNTYTKDLLEFGAVQHWDTTAGGGNQWAYFNAKDKDLWPQIVAMMGKAGFSVLPYYEYSGSKGASGLGNQRRARPLRRDDAYSHISWVESANADVTDPDTFIDFKKMLDLTVVQLRDRAPFAGAWIRSRGQLPISFADAALGRFKSETGLDGPLTRQRLIDDADLLSDYKRWWLQKRREFLLAMRDHLRNNGITDANILYTAEASEPGVPFPSWEPFVVTDSEARLNTIDPVDEKHRITPLPISEVNSGHRYLDALTAAPLNWGDWELDHRSPPSDPQTYSGDDGVLLTHAFNRLYTVTDPETFKAFRNPSGLAIVRHYSLNENMMYDDRDREILGYFIADFERAGPFCMMAEAHAVAGGDPSMIGYLSGGNFNRGFPRYVRNFNAAFLSLPALPSQLITGCTPDPEIVVRQITTPNHGHYFAIINLGTGHKYDAAIRLPVDGQIFDATTGTRIPPSNDNTIHLNMHPYQLHSLHIP